MTAADLSPFVNAMSSNGSINLDNFIAHLCKPGLESVPMQEPNPMVAELVQLLCVTDCNIPFLQTTNKETQTDSPTPVAGTLRQQVHTMTAAISQLEQELAARSAEAQQWRAKCAQLTHSDDPTRFPNDALAVLKSHNNLCPSFLLGKCTDGDSCVLSHISGWDTVRVQGTKVGVLDASHYVPEDNEEALLDGLSQDSDLSNLAGILGKEKEVLCFNFLAGKCRHTEKCTRSHATGWKALACRGIMKEDLNPVVLQSLCRLPQQEQTELLNQIASIPNLQRIHNLSAYLADRMRRQFPAVVHGKDVPLQLELCPDFLLGKCELDHHCTRLHKSGWDALKFIGVEQSHFEHEVLKSLRTLSPAAQTAVLNEMATCRLSSIRNLSGFLAHVIDKHRKRGRGAD